MFSILKLMNYRSLIIIFWLFGFHSLKGQKNIEEYQLKISKTNENIILDGKLDEALWKKTELATDFSMNFPLSGDIVKDEVQTFVRLAYDDDYIYLGIECFGKGPYLVQSLKRDNFWSGDAFAVVLDPVNEGTNAFIFGVNPSGIQTEALITGEPARRSFSFPGYNPAWDNKWYTEASISSDKWTAEMMIPFRSLRFGNKNAWGINFVRIDAKTNTHHSWAPVPVQFFAVDLGFLGQLIWEKRPKKVKRNIALIPYLSTDIYKNFESFSGTNYGYNAGMDAKISITSNLNLDVTINPDFSQVDVDEQQTNLTTVNLTFPERRIFFLENNDIFNNFGTYVKPFFSRKIGLDDNGNTIPILFGARLSGNINKNLRIGAMNTQTQSQDSPGNNYSSFAIHQRILKRSTVRGYFHNRQAYTSETILSGDFNRIGGLEFNYSSKDSKWRSIIGYGLAFSENEKKRNHLYNILGGYGGEAFSLMFNVSGLGDNYLNDFSLIPRQMHYDAIQDTTYLIGFNHWWISTGYKFYPKDKLINQHGINISTRGDKTSTTNNLIQSEINISYFFLFKNTSSLMLIYSNKNANLLYPFRFTDGLPLPEQLYHFANGNISYSTDDRREVKLTTRFNYGGFYNGTRAELSLDINYRIQPWGNFSVKFSQNNLKFPAIYGSEELFLFGPKAEINFSKNFFWTTFIQYNTQIDNFNVNSRIQWRYLPMSDLFIVYSDNYLIENFVPRDRTLVIKFNYWFNL